MLCAQRVVSVLLEEVAQLLPFLAMAHYSLCDQHRQNKANVLLQLPSTFCT